MRAFNKRKQPKHTTKVRYKKLDNGYYAHSKSNIKFDIKLRWIPIKSKRYDINDFLLICKSYKKFNN
jgi:hypothetical protein